MTIQCKYQLPEIASEENYSCPHPRQVTHPKDELCIFHRPKLSAEDKNKLTPAELSNAISLEILFNTSLRQFIDDAEDDGEHDTSDQPLDMRGFHFPPTYFDESFMVRPDFSHAVFVEYGDFATPKWKQHSSIVFHLGATFDDTVFLGGANFSRTVFKEKADFNSAHFMKDADFSFTFFAGDGIFSNCTFRGSAEFWSSRFEGGAEFDDASFDGSLNCAHAKFKSANFFGIKVNGASFQGSVFEGDAHIFVASISSYLYLDGASFREMANLASCSWPPKVRFEKTEFKKDCILTDIEIPRDAVVTLVEVDLSRAQFGDTNVENINFRDVRWAPVKTIAGYQRRSALWDEFRELDEGEERRYEKIAENYRQLVINYEQKRNYETAEDFHIGEMEMRRKKKGSGVHNRPWRLVREWFNLFGFYKISSNYGSSYRQAFLVLSILFALFSTLFLFGGFQPSKDNVNVQPNIIEYNLLPDNSHHWNGPVRLLKDYGKAAMFTLSIITFQKDRFYEPVGWQSQLFLYSSLLILTAQAALVLLAVRRQFRR
jgi:uncharacterized protein YjbI with pentapeptide repeats